MAGDVLQCSLLLLSCFCLQFLCDRVRFIGNQSPEGLHKACWILAQGLLSLGSFCLDWSLAWFFTRAWQSSSRTTLGFGSQLGGHYWVTHAAFPGWGCVSQLLLPDVSLRNFLFLVGFFQ